MRHAPKAAQHPVPHLCQPSQLNHQLCLAAARLSLQQHDPAALRRGCYALQHAQHAWRVGHGLLLVQGQAVA